MKFQDITNKSVNELSKMLEEQKVKLGKMRFELTHKTLKNFSEINKARRDVARILTALNTKHGE